MRISEYLELKDRIIRCVKCGSIICSSNENFKSKVIMKEEALTKASPLNKPTDKYVLREYYCPKCATLLEVDVLKRDENVYWDKIKGESLCIQ